MLLAWQEKRDSWETAWEGWICCFPWESSDNARTSQMPALKCMQCKGQTKGIRNLWTVAEPWSHWDYKDVEMQLGWLKCCNGWTPALWERQLCLLPRVGRSDLAATDVEIVSNHYSHLSMLRNGWYSCKAMIVFGISEDWSSFLTSWERQTLEGVEKMDPGSSKRCTYTSQKMENSNRIY